MNNPPSRERLYSSQQQDILAAAKAIIARQGIGNLSIRTLANAIDMSPSAIYKYFDGKEAILEAIADEGFTLLLYRLHRAIKRATTPSMGVMRLANAYLVFAAEQPQLYNLMLANDSSGDGLLPGTQLNQTFQLLVSVIQAGIDKGEFHEQQNYGVMQIAFHLWTSLHGMAMLKTSAMASNPDFDSICEQVIGAIVASLRR